MMTCRRRYPGPRTWRRVALLTLLLELSGLILPAVQAATAYPSGGTAAEYSAGVQERVSLRNDLEEAWRQARDRRRQIDAAIQDIQAEEPPPGGDLAAWYRDRSQRIRALDEYLRKNEETVTRYQASLGHVYSKLDEDRRFLQSSSDSDLKQALGSLVGIAGVAAIPVATRPHLGSLRTPPGQAPPAARASVVSRGTVKGGGVINPKVPKVVPPTSPAPTAAATAAPTGAPRPGGAAASAEAGATGVRTVEQGWRTDISKKGTIVLKRGDRVIDTKDPAAIKDGAGKKAELVRNEAAWQRAEGMKTLYTSKDALTTSIRDLKSQLKTAPKEAQKTIKSQIKEMQAQEKALAKDIKTAEQGAKSPSALKSLAGSAAKWALFSTGLTVAMRAFDQLRENDWDVTSIDWKDAVAPLKTPEFWGGTAGSFGLSMLVSAVIPGGTFIRTLGAIGGAAVGWQIGSGSLHETDWAELGASTLGATIGSILGSALGPVGTFLGGLAGHFLATWALGKLRDWLEQGSTSYSSDDRQVVDLDGDVTPYAGGNPSRASPSAPVGGDAAAIRLRMDQIYRQIESLMQDPQAGAAGAQQIRELHEEYDGLFRQLEAMRAQGPGGTQVAGVGSWNE